ncbi:hypothetical protein PENSPDRAFT_687515 [Peniophora sp. CONT]|nr:hypothetical protein PENSPDRAFT_687515 [Peniophora sp. CONT]
MSDFQSTTPPRWTSRFETHPEPPTLRLSVPTDEDDDSGSSGHPDCVSYCTTPASTPPTSPTLLHRHELSYAEDTAELSTRITLLSCLLVGLALSLWEPAPLPPGITVRFADRPFQSALLALKHAWPEGRRGVAVFLLVTFGIIMVVRSIMHQRAGAAVRPDEKNSLPWGLRGRDMVNMESQMAIFWEGLRVQ